MDKTIILNNREITYTLERKAVKNVNLRIRPDGSVYLSANRYVTLEAIENFLRTKADFILAALDKCTERAKHNTQERRYITGERFRLLGKNLQLIVSSGKNQVYADDSHLFLRLPDPNDFQSKKRLIDKWYDRQCQAVFAEIIAEIYPTFQQYGLQMPKVSLRTMKSRWGSCSPTRGAITLNKRLIEAPRAAIEYVVMHEFTHFLHPNHAKPFYDTLSMLMPDWKSRKKLLP